MSVEQIDTRVIDDDEYWKNYLRFNREAKKVFNHVFLVKNDEQEEVDEIIRWCRANTKGLMYVSKMANLESFGLGPQEARFYIADNDDAILFKLTWVK